MPDLCQKIKAKLRGGGHATVFFFCLPFFHASQLRLNQRDPALADGKACESSLRAMLQEIILVLALDWRSGSNLVDLSASE